MSFSFFLKLFLIAGFSLIGRSVNAQGQIPDNVMEIFENKCAFSGCHAGASSSAGLDLTQEQAYVGLVSQPSVDFPNIALVKPGNPVRSYLMMKLVGTKGMKGQKMPTDKPLTKPELRAVAAWIRSIPTNVQAAPQKKIYAESFPGLSVGALQTTQVLPQGSISYRIAHRWTGNVDTGYQQLFGLDVGAHMLTEFTFALTNNFVLTAGRSGQLATYEFNGKWQIWREKNNGSMPFSMGLFAGADWMSQPGLNLNVSDRVSLYSQVIMEKRLSSRISFLMAPGILINGNYALTNEKPLITIGFAGKFSIFKSVALFFESSPILTGSNTALPAGGAAIQNGTQTIVYDSFTIGLEQNLGGHVFHLYVTNSLGLTPSQVMSGGNLDFSKGKMRLGFNIYRVIRNP